jgi:hypothetical protein
MQIAIIVSIRSYKREYNIRIYDVVSRRDAQPYTQWSRIWLPGSAIPISHQPIIIQSRRLDWGSSLIFPSTERLGLEKNLK